MAASEIEQICKAKLKVEPEEVLDPHDPGALSAAVRQLQRAAEAAAEEGGAPPTLDPERDLKINQYDLVQAIRERARLMQVAFSLRAARAIFWCRPLVLERIQPTTHQVTECSREHA